MAFSVSLVEKCRRGIRRAERLAEIVSGILAPFRLFDVYPPFDVEIGGTMYSRKSVMQHQRKLHEGTTISGRKAKFALVNGGVGSGKSVCMCAEMVRLSREYPGIKIVICASGDTIVGGAPLGDRVQPEKVYTVNGESPASVPFRRGQADLWNVQTQSGRAISVTGGHRFLTPSGWRPLSSLSVGDVIACDGRLHEDSDLGIPKGFRAGYRTGLHSCDALLSPQVVACLHTVQQIFLLYRDTIRRLSSSGSQGHASHRTASSEHHLRSGFAALSPFLLGDRQQSTDMSLLTGSERSCLEQDILSGVQGLPPDLCESVLEVFSILSLDAHHLTWQSLSGFPSPGNQQGFAFDHTCNHFQTCVLSGFLTYGALSQCVTDLRLASSRLSPGNQFLDTLSRLLQGLSSLQLLSVNNDTLFWDELSSISYKKYEDYYDLTVFHGSNYSAAGVLSHNCTGYDYYFDEFILPTFWSVFGDPDDNPYIKKYNAKSRMIVLTNGSTIRFKAYDDPDKVKGWEAHIIWVEEASELGDGNSEKAMLIWQALLMRLRAKRPKYPLRMYVSQNPKGHNWTWKVFIKGNPLGDDGVETIVPPETLCKRHNGAASSPLSCKSCGKGVVRPKDAIKDPDYPVCLGCFTGRDKAISYYEWEKITPNGDTYYTISTGSAANTNLAAGYVDSMLDQLSDNPEIRKRMVEGKFNPINTLVYEYPIYSDRTHIIQYKDFLEYWEIESIPVWWPVIVGIDCGGARSPWAVEFYVKTPDGHYVCFDEIYQAGLTWGEVALRILRKVKPVDKLEQRIRPEQYDTIGEYEAVLRDAINEVPCVWENISFWIDPISSNQKAGPTAITIKDEFKQWGITTEYPKGYNKQGGIMKVQSFLKRNLNYASPYHQEDYQDDQGQWYIGASNLYYLASVPQYHEWGAKWCNIAYAPDGKELNPLRLGAYANIKEKSVFRYDSRKARQPKESEEGLTPFVSEKVMDRDDHAQTAEMFCLLGAHPFDGGTYTRSRRDDSGGSGPKYGHRGGRR